MASAGGGHLPGPRKPTPAQLNTARVEFAGFLLSQFGTQTLAEWNSGNSSAGDLQAADPYVLASLTDEETVARLATGIKRFKLPDEFNPIKIYQGIADDPKTGHGEEALGGLASIFENRRQFDRAVQYLERSRVLYGDKDNSSKRLRLDQILGTWGEFGSGTTQPAGHGATAEFRFRNGRHVHFEAHEILVAKLLGDVKSYLASQPRQVDWQETDISDIGSRLVARDQQQYLGPRVAQWDLDVEPLAGHFDKRITVTTPLQNAGAYLLTGQMEGGNTSRILVWLDDTVIVKKPLADKAYYFIADTRTGQPIAMADVALFGWRTVQVRGKNEFDVDTKSIAVKTDGEGQVQVPASNPNEPGGAYQWLITATNSAGRFAHLGFVNTWFFGRHDPAQDEAKAYAITDRPVYRPGSPVRFKFWVAHARYDQVRGSEYAGKEFPVEIHNPKGEKIFAKSFTTDTFGGFDGSFELPSDATLGVYHVFIPNRGAGNFRVEEYKKPEFELKVDAPAQPVMLGEKVTATIKASYYFGGPVTEAKVKYTITRAAADERWYPVARWDWLFGAGYWWFAGDYSWYPGWSSWGMRRPAVAWWRQPPAPPEVVAETELPIGSDGTLTVAIDTAAAKAAHPDQDHRYEISAEVTDQSRRTIAGKGTVLVARKPFAVYTWVDRGHYRAGDTIDAQVYAQTLDHRPVVGKGTFRLFKIDYDHAPAGRNAGRKLGASARCRRSCEPKTHGRRYGSVSLGSDSQRRQGPRDRRRLFAHDHRPGIRRCKLPIQ